eukprot:6262485-Prymnesium_polylepis.1
MERNGSLLRAPASGRRWRALMGVWAMRMCPCRVGDVCLLEGRVPGLALTFYSSTHKSRHFY